MLTPKKNLQKIFYTRFKIIVIYKAYIMPNSAYVTIKIPLKSITNDEIIEDIQYYVIIVNKIVTRSLLLLRAYLISCDVIPVLNENFIDTLLKTVCIQDNRGRPPSVANQLLRSKLKIIHDRIFRGIPGLEPLSYTHLSTVLDYCATTILTDIENNIKQRYTQYIESFVNASFRLRQYLSSIKIVTDMTTRNSLKYAFIKKLRLIKTDLMNTGSLKSDIIYHSWITYYKTKLIPNRPLKKDSIKYDIQCSPQDYLPGLIYIVKTLEKMNNEHILINRQEQNRIEQYILNNPNLTETDKIKLRITNKSHIKLKNISPLRTSIVPKHIRIDTTTLVNMFYNLDKETKNNPEFYSKEEILTDGNLKRNKDEIWSLFFNIEPMKKEQLIDDNGIIYPKLAWSKHIKNIKKKGYSFDNQMTTDGVSCSLLFIKKELKNGTIAEKRVKDEFTEQYLSDLSNEQLRKYSEYDKVAIDANMGDLLYCTGEEYDGCIKDHCKNSDCEEHKHQREHLRYTQDSRRKTMKTKKYAGILEEQKGICLVNERGVGIWESMLSSYDHKTVSLRKFYDYIGMKIFVNNKIEEFYTRYIFRKLKLNTFINTQKSEQLFMNTFTKTFGPPKTTLIGIGDWGQYEHRKYKEPVKGKGFRKMLRTYGYETYLIDENCTSKRCFECKTNGYNCETFKSRMHPDINREERKSRIVHGLLMCQHCKKVWNRDVNASLNILEIITSIVNGKERPLYLEKINSTRLIQQELNQ
jgi:hypothetical protein